MEKNWYLLNLHSRKKPNALVWSCLECGFCADTGWAKVVWLRDWNSLDLSLPHHTLSKSPTLSTALAQQTAPGRVARERTTSQCVSHSPPTEGLCEKDVWVTSISVNTMSSPSLNNLWKRQRRYHASYHVSRVKAFLIYYIIQLLRSLRQVVCKKKDLTCSTYIGVDQHWKLINRI